MKRLLVLLAIAAAARLAMQMAAMPPYAGLDEAYHVARLAFVASEGRNPRTGEASIPPYLVDSLNLAPGVPPVFDARWPELVRTRGEGVARDRVLSSADLRPYVLPNYETQQPSLYYSVTAPLVRFLPRRTQLGELFLWRLLSLVFAVTAVVAAGIVGWRVAGGTGIVAAGLIVAFPTWQTLVMRAGNDALACAAIAVAFAISFSAPRTRRGIAAEGVAWALALAVKLYSWPAAVALLPLWRSQRAPRARWLTVMACGAVAVGLTAGDLALRTRNPVGLFAFDAPAAAVKAAVPIAWAEVVKIFVATMAWTSGPHNNALRPVAIVLYLLPLAVLVGAGAVARRRDPVVTTCAIAAAAFALAQTINLAGYVRLARAAGEVLPAGGKEGWYWFALAPLFIAALLAVILHRAPRWLLVAAVLWIGGWDLFLTEGALFGDWAGRTGPLHGDAWLRWGPRAFVSDWVRGALRAVWAVATALMMRSALIILPFRTDTFPRHR